MLSIIVFLLLLRESQGRITVKTSRTIDLIENSRIGTKIASLNELFPTIKLRQRSFDLLNLNGFEKNYFDFENENLFTKHLIDREEFVEKRYCSNENICEIELHLLVNDVSSYLIIPIHIIE